MIIRLLPEDLSYDSLIEKLYDSIRKGDVSRFCEILCTLEEKDEYEVSWPLIMSKIVASEGGVVMMSLLLDEKEFTVHATRQWVGSMVVSIQNCRNDLVKVLLSAHKPENTDIWWKLWLEIAVHRDDNELFCLLLPWASPDFIPFEECISHNREDMLTILIHTEHRNSCPWADCIYYAKKHKRNDILSLLIFESPKTPEVFEAAKSAFFQAVCDCDDEAIRHILSPLNWQDRDILFLALDFCSYVRTEDKRRAMEFTRSYNLIFEDTFKSDLCIIGQPVSRRRKPSNENQAPLQQFEMIEMTEEIEMITMPERTEKNPTYALIDIRVLDPDLPIYHMLTVMQVATLSLSELQEEFAKCRIPMKVWYYCLMQAENRGDQEILDLINHTIDAHSHEIMFRHLRRRY